MRNKKVKEITYLQSKKRLKRYYIIVQKTEDALAFHKELSNEVGINAKWATIALNTNALTTFLFAKVIESLINNVSKKVIDLMIVLYCRTFTLVQS